MIFELLGKILDDVPEQIRFRTAWDGSTLFVECSESDIIGNLILPLFDDGEVEHLLASSWFVATLKMSHDQIAEITIANDAGKEATFKVGTTILKELSAVGMDDSYIKMCHEITKKCGYLVDKTKIV